MTPIEIIAQIIGIIAMAMNLISYQQKSQKRVIAFQFFGSLLFSINFFMLGAYVGAMLNLIGIVRAIVFYYKEKTHATHIAWLIGFTASYVLAYVLSFTVFDTEPSAPRLLLEILPVIAMIIATVAFRRKSAGDIRKFGLVYSPLWLIYNVFNLSIGAIGCEILNIISIITAMIRLDRKNKDANNFDA